jgi:hypothetical protein
MAQAVERFILALMGPIAREMARIPSGSFRFMLINGF